MKSLVVPFTTALQPLSSSHRLVLGWKPAETVIPAVPGEFYAYPSDFIVGKPLYALMKCRANKSRILAEAGQLGREANLLFQFDAAACASVCATKTAHAHGLLGTIAGQPFGETWVKPVAMSAEEFYEVCARKDPAPLAEICQEACMQREVSADLEQGTVIAMMTDGGKYGLFLVTELTAKSIGIDACHVLLP